MSIFKPVTIEQVGAKVGIFARQGAGKTTTGALIAIGLSKTYHKGAPVWMLDTENGSDYLEPVFKAEGVELIVGKSRAFVDMRQGLREATSSKACVYFVDSYTHPWGELTTSFKAKSKRKKLEFHHMDELKGIWREWTDQMLASDLHVLMAGRLGFEWGEEENEDTGRRDLIKLGTKMKGETEAGYEPSLLIEMEALQDADTRLKKTRTKRGSIVHHAYVLKDRWRVLNGRTFQFKDINDYKVGQWKTVFDAFRPHFDRLAIGGTQRALDGNRSSETLFTASGETEFAARAKRTQIALEEIKELGTSIWPGQDAASKKAKATLLEILFATLSWTAVEQKPVAELEDAVAVLRSVRESARDENVSITDPAWIALAIQEGRDWVTQAKVEAATSPF